MIPRASSVCGPHVTLVAPTPAFRHNREEPNDTRTDHHAILTGCAVLIDDRVIGRLVKIDRYPVESFDVVGQNGRAISSELFASRDLHESAPRIARDGSRVVASHV